jgi:CTP:molybdopterin cytidylyltransferase MocA
MTTGNFSAIILAAGFSTRMKRFKPLLRIGEKTFLEHAIALFKKAGIGDIVTVVGHGAEKLIPVVRAASSRCVLNDHYHEGMFSSIQQGVKALRHPCEAFFLLPVDIPLVLPATVRQLSMAFGQNSLPMVCYPQFQSRRGHPPLVNSQLIDEILSHGGQGGLRALLRDHEEHAISIPVEDPFIRLDADTRKDLLLIRKKYALYASLQSGRS